jgi:SAM-dependent methyltransferase
LDASAWDERYRSADRLWSSSPNIFVADRLGTIFPKTGIDLAAGDGRNAIWLAEKGWSMTAVDFSEVAVDVGKSISNQVEFVVGDVRTWKTDGRFDLVLISYLHLPAGEMESVVSAAGSWLMPGGELFMIGHDRSNIEDGTGGPQVPEILWDVGEMTSWAADLTLIEAQVVRRPVTTENGQVFARDALIRARA